MALEIINKEIVGEIDDLDAKLSGEKPVTRLELLHLANSWDRYYDFNTNNNEIEIKFFNIKNKNKYNLSKLDVSQITNISDIFMYSKFNGDISKWDVSNVTDMACMFSGAKKFNSDIGNWDISKVTDMTRLFNGATIFNQDISKWDVSNVIDMVYMFAFSSFNQDIS